MKQPANGWAGVGWKRDGRGDQSGRPRCAKADIMLSMRPVRVPTEFCSAESCEVTLFSAWAATATLRRKALTQLTSASIFCLASSPGRRRLGPGRQGGGGPVGIRVSLSGKGNCYDNSALESFFKSIKPELVWRTNWQTRRDVKVALFNTSTAFITHAVDTQHWAEKAP